MKKICFVVFNIALIGGQERVNSVIASMLSENPNYDITLLSLFGDSMNSHFDLSISDKVKVKWLIHEPLHFRKDALKVIKKIETEVKSSQYDIIVSGDVRSYFAYIKMKNRNKFKLVLWEHSSNYIVQSFSRNCAKKIQMIFTDKMIVLTERDKESYVNTYGYPNKVHRIYNPYSFNQESKPNLKSKKILTMARLSEVKRLDYIIEIGKIIFKRFPDWSWDIYGGGDQYDILNTLIKVNAMGNNIFLKGVCDNPKGIYPKYSIFGLTSKYEGLGLVLLEAKISKLPLISFDVYCGPSEIIEDGLNGYLIPPFNIEIYAEKIMLLMENEELRKKFSENSSIGFDKFTISTINEQWTNLLDSL